MCGVSTLEYFKEFFKAAIKREQFQIHSRNVERELAQVNLKAIMQERTDYERSALPLCFAKNILPMTIGIKNKNNLIRTIQVAKAAQNNCFLRLKFKLIIFNLSVINMNIKKETGILISLASLFLMCTPPPIGWYRWNVLLFVITVFVLSLLYANKHINWRMVTLKTMPINASVALLLLYVIFGIFFVTQFQHSFRVNALAEDIHIHRLIIAFVGFLPLALLSWPVLSCIVTDYMSYEGVNKCENRKTDSIILFLSSIIVITLFSKSSFLYPLNDWVDANDYHTIGKSVLYGYVPYRDLFDHKGPILYFLHTFNGLVSFRSFFGIYLLEIVSCFLYLMFSYRTLSLFIQKNTITVMPIIAFIVYSAWCFEQGDSAEEFCLPALAYGLWVGMKSIKRNIPLSVQEGIITGISIGWVFWIKYSILGFFVGFFMFFAAYYLYKKQYKEMFSSIRNVLVGFVVISIPVIAYFAWHNALFDLYQVYFHDNIFLYNSTGEQATLVDRIFIKGFYGAYCRDFIFFMLLIGGLVVVAKERRMILFYFTCFLFSILFAYIAQTIYVYYTLPLAIFVPTGAVLLLPLVTQGNRIIRTVIVSALCLTIMFSCLNFQMILQPKASRPQYKFKEIICQTKSPTLLNYEYGDMGLFAICGILPTNKYFFASHLKHDYIMTQQDEVIKNGEVDFIVTKSYTPNSAPKFPNYELVAEEYYINWYRGPEYMYLYKKK